LPDGKKGEKGGQKRVQKLAKKCQNGHFLAKYGFFRKNPVFDKNVTFLTPFHREAHMTKMAMLAIFGQKGGAKGRGFGRASDPK
jgi:hypothetical protein